MRKEDPLCLVFLLQIPVSMCSKSCQPGQRKKPVGLHPCCFECMDCPAGTYLNLSAGTAPTAPAQPFLSRPRVLYMAQHLYSVLEFSGVPSLCQSLWGLPRECEYPVARDQAMGLLWFPMKQKPRDRFLCGTLGSVLTLCAKHFTH